MPTVELVSVSWKLTVAVHERGGLGLGLARTGRDDERDD